MADPNQFEMIVKMNRLSPICFEYNFKKADLHQNINDEQYDHMVHTLEKDKNLHSLQFFKDPVCPFDEQIKEQNTSTFKPGRNMRACKNLLSQCKDASELMTRRKGLLQRQREQKLKFETAENSEKMASALVNGLLHHGFSIDPPEQTPRFNQSDTKMPAFKNVKPINEKMLVVDIHRELKRVQEI